MPGFRLLFPEYFNQGDNQMAEQIVRGSVKSKTIVGNGAGILGLAYFWNDPMLATVPDEVKYIVLAVFAANILLRYFTNEPVSEKGRNLKKENDKALGEAVYTLVQEVKALREFSHGQTHVDGGKPIREQHPPKKAELPQGPDDGRMTELS